VELGLGHVIVVWRTGGFHGSIIAEPALRTKRQTAADYG
jgi:hypothetical protein